MKFEIGAGYRQLEIGETIATGDDVWIGGQWDSTADAGRSEPRIETNPGPEPEYGWRLLRPGEVVIKGDRKPRYDGVWTEASFLGMVVQHGRIERRIDPGEGYRLLAVGERIVEGDDIYWHGKVQWLPTALVGSVVRDAVFRRKVVDPGAGYRSLKVGEIITAGDEFFNTQIGMWQAFHYAIGQKLMDYPDMSARRKLESKVYPGVGYRRLSAGEIIADGDEYLVRKVWQPFQYVIGTKLDAVTVVRRRIEPPRAVIEKKYRLLSAGEIIIAGDEFFLNTTGKWENAQDYGILVVNDWHAPIRRAMELGYIGGPA